jgi:phosphohistidine phosphatase
MKRLIVLRHAKSDWDADFGTDHERPLARRGIAAARTMGVTLANMDQIPELVYSSSAVRARTTVDLAAEAGGWDTTIELSDDLYGTSADGALAVATRAAPEVDRLMLVGHQPTWGMLVYQLTGGRVQVKTATAVGIDLSIGSWREVTNAHGEIAYVLQPRLFTDGSWDLAPGP